jgi:hypothetical protein
MSSIVGYPTCVPDDGFSFDCPRTPPATAHVVASSIVMVSVRLIVGVGMVSVLSALSAGHRRRGPPAPASRLPLSTLFGHAVGTCDRKSSAERRFFLVIGGRLLS